MAQPHSNFLPLHFTSHHFTSLHYTSLHLSTLHFFLFKLHPTTPHFPHLAQPHSNFLPHHFTSHHFTLPHVTSLHLTALHCTFRQFRHTSIPFTSPPFIIAFLTFYVNILLLQMKEPIAPAGSWIQSVMPPTCAGILTDIRSLLPVPNFQNMTNPTQILRSSLPFACNFRSQLPQNTL